MAITEKEMENIGLFVEAVQHLRSALHTMESMEKLSDREEIIREVRRRLKRRGLLGWAERMVGEKLKASKGQGGVEISQADVRRVSEVWAAREAEGEPAP